jgi:hypothetical protein
LAVWGKYLDGEPPSLRSAQLVALMKAGVVQGIGPNVAVAHDGIGFVASSPDVDGSTLRVPYTVSVCCFSTAGSV